ncbi:MAG: hypothetical protein NTW21_26840 [Verrucomicrobia bacterium]|nr:hypothetical protein [Verrucomicrobiota bacterium]
MMKMNALWCAVVAGWCGAPAVMAAVELKQDDAAGQVVLCNEVVSLAFNMSKGTYAITDKTTGQLMVDQAGLSADSYENADSMKFTWTREEAKDALGAGKRLVVAMEHTKPRAVPVYLFTFTVYEGRGGVVMGFGMRNTMDFGMRLMKVQPLAHGRLLAGSKLEKPQTLNGAAGADTPRVEATPNRECPNSLLLTGTQDGKRRSFVWGGMANKEFGKWVDLRDGVMQMRAEDPVGRVVDPGKTYISEDTLYLDVTQPDPFVALETYGLAMRAANHARPNAYDFPTLCGWAVGALSGLGDINNTVALIKELEMAQKAGVTKYTKVAIRLEPDTYCYGDGNTEQGWWDDAHWSKYGHLKAPYDTFAKWCAALQERDGIPFTYFQVGLPSDDYARAFPGHMLFNDISRLQVKHPHHQPLVTYDYTDPDFQQHVLATWQRLKMDGMQGIKFDYPETGWQPGGGFENQHATTAFAYREVFRLCREGLGPDAFIHERNLGETGRPLLDVTAGLVDMQRVWGDSNDYVPEMVSTCGLRWYKNRVVFGYYPDSKAVHNRTPEVRQSLLTMVFLTSGRVELATSFRLFTPDMLRDVTRIYPLYREPRSARPLDAFTGVPNPRVYDLELTPEWHQVALFNPDKTNAGPISVALSGEHADGAIGLDPAASYYAYDFWSDTLVGKYPGTATVEKQLGPTHCAMLSIRKVQQNPQVLSTNRHVLQGWVDLADVKWDGQGKCLSGVARVIGGEPFKIVVGGNGSTATKVTATGAQAKLEKHPADGLAQITLERPENGEVSWQVTY